MTREGGACRLAAWTAACVLLALAAVLPARAQTQTPEMRILLIDADHIRFVGSADAIEGMLHDAPFDWLPQPDRLVLIVQKSGRLDSFQLRAKSGAGLRAELIDKTGLDPRRPGTPLPANRLDRYSGINLSILRREVLRWMGRLAPSGSGPGGSDVATVEMMVFAARWHLDQSPQLANFLNYRYPAECVARYAGDDSVLWPDDVRLDIEFRPPVEIEHSGAKGHQAMAVALFGTASPPDDRLHYRGALGAFCKERGALQKSSDLRDAIGAEMAALGIDISPDIETECSINPPMFPREDASGAIPICRDDTLDGVNPGLVRRPLFMWLRDGGGVADTAEARVLSGRDRLGNPAIGDIAVPPAASSTALDDQRLGQLDGTLPFSASGACRGNAPAEIELDLYLQASPSTTRQRVRVVSPAAPCAAEELPIGRYDVQ